MTKNKYLFATLLFASLAACDNAPPERGARGERATLVETTLVQSSDVSRTVERNGTLRPLREAHLALQQEGLLIALPYHEGDTVQKGDVLVQLDDSLLRAQLKKSEAQRSQAALDLKRLQGLRRSQLVAEEELSRATTALDVARAEEEELRIRLQQTHLLAPFNGTISARLVEPGDTLSRLTHVLTLIDTSSLITEIRLSEMELGGLQLGSAASVRIDALGAQSFSGVIERIHPAVDEATRQGVIEVRLDTPPPGARPGQLCRVTLQLHSTARLLIPYNALRRDTRGEFLFVVNGENRVERRTIVSGAHYAEQVEVLNGLNAGERIVSRGFLGLAEGSLVREGGEAPAEPRQGKRPPQP